MGVPLNKMLDRPAATGPAEQAGAGVAWDQRIRWLIPVIYAGCAAAFLADVMVDVFYVPFGIFYIPLVCTAVFHRDRRSAWWLAAAATAMVSIGFFYPSIAPNVGRALFTRGLSVSAIFATAALVRYARGIQDRLARQTARAEAAERVKTEVFLTLSQEMRTPLQSMVSLLEVMIADCRADQRVLLKRVQNDSKRLSASIENLIDLTNFGERPIFPQTVDVSQLLVQAAEANRAMAAQRQISVELDLPASTITARADPWAVRRILDNLIANAVKFSPAGAHIQLAAEQRSGAVALLVRDEGIGIADDVLQRLSVPDAQDVDHGPVTGTGIALCHRLARSMEAELGFDSELGSGTTATLRLPG